MQQVTDIGFVTKGNRPQNRKRKFLKKKKPTMSTKVLQMEKKMKSMIKNDAPPIKYTYVEGGPVSASDSWTPVNIVWPLLSSGLNARLQDIIQVKSYQLKFTIDPSTGLGSENENNVRIAMIQFVDSNASGSSTGAVGLGQVWLGYDGDYTWLNPYNPLTKSKYRVLFDKTYAITFGGIATICDEIMVTSLDMTVNKGKMVYSNDGELNTNYPGLEGGFICAFITSDSSAAPHPQFTYTARLNFTDT